MKRLNCKNYSQFQIERIHISDWFTKELLSLKPNQKPNFKRLALKIEKSEKQTQRLWQLFLNQDPNFFEHKNTNKRPANKCDESTEMKIINTFLEYQKKYNELGNNLDVLTHSQFVELSNIVNELNISEITIRKILNKYHCFTKNPWRSTKRKAKKANSLERTSITWLEELNKNLQNYFSNYKLFEETQYQPRKKSGAFGKYVEVDGCFHDFLGCGKQCIYNAIYVETNILLDLHMEKEETTQGYYILLDGIFKKYGLPETIKTDCRTSFIDNRNQEYDTQLSLALKRLGVTVKCSSDPQFKATVERCNRTIQDNLPYLVMALKIKTVEEFNNRKQEVIDYLNSKMKHTKQTDNYFCKVDDYMIDNEMCYTIKRKATDICTVYLNNQEYFAETPSGKVLVLKKRATVYIRYHFKNNKFYIYANGHKNYLRLADGDKWEILETYLSSKPDKVVVDLQRLVKKLNKKCEKLDQECANLKNRLRNEKTVYGLGNL